MQRTASLAVVMACSVSVGCGSSNNPATLTPGAQQSEADGGARGPLLIPSNPTFCSIAAKVASSKPDASDSVMPTTHEFSLLIDWAGNTATTGASGNAKKVPLSYRDGVWTTQAPLVLPLKLAVRPVYTYDEISISPTATGCMGQATGHYEWNSSDVVFTIPFEAVLAGVADRDVPVFSVFPDVKTPHPFDFIGVSVNELLPAGTTATWAGIPMLSLPEASDTGVSGFSFKGHALAFGSTYWLNVLPSAADLAGNVATSLVGFATMAGPGLLAQDGFESNVDALITGKVKVVDATTMKIPSGAKALQFAPTWMVYGEWDCEDRFTARLAVTPGAQAVKLSAFTYQPKSQNLMPFDPFLQLAVPNGAVSDFGYRWSSGGVVKSSSPATSVDFSYGDDKEYVFALPAGVGNEVMVDLRRPCIEPGFPSPGIVIDDLRVE